MRDTDKKDTYSLFSKDLFLKDLDSLTNLTEADVLIRSGQYFITLATKLDRLSDQLKKGDEIQKHHLQEIIEQLLFIQQHYRINKKSPRKSTS